LFPVWIIFSLRVSISLRTIGRIIDVKQGGTQRWEISLMRTVTSSILHLSIMFHYHCCTKVWSTFCIYIYHFISCQTILVPWSLPIIFNFQNKAVCDDTQNLTETESETFFDTDFLDHPNHQCIFWDWSALQKLRILLLEVISLWRYPKSESKTFFDTKFYRYRIRYFFQYQVFTIPNPILFPIPNFFDTESETIQKMKKFRKPRSYETETSHSGIKCGEQWMIEKTF